MTCCTNAKIMNHIPWRHTAQTVGHPKISVYRELQRPGTKYNQMRRVAGALGGSECDQSTLTDCMRHHQISLVINLMMMASRTLPGFGDQPTSHTTHYNRYLPKMSPKMFLISTNISTNRIHINYFFCKWHIYFQYFGQWTGSHLSPKQFLSSDILFVIKVAKKTWFK